MLLVLMKMLKGSVIQMNDISDMIAELEEYYECAGFANFYDRVLKDMTEEEIIAYYKQTFEVKGNAGDDE